MYKLAFVVPSGKSTRLWMCDQGNGARTIPVHDGDIDEIIAALLSEGWEPIGIGLENSVWFRKSDGREAHDIQVGVEGTICEDMVTIHH